MTPLTKRQAQILSFIERSTEKTGVVPSSREIQEHFGFASQTAAMNHLRSLERKGAIRRHAGKARGVVLSRHLERDTLVDVPLLGHIAAGMASPADQEHDGLVSVDAKSAGLRFGGKYFALRVRGDSMTGAGIHDGDLAVMEMREPVPGDIVAALIDGETTLKRCIMTRGKPCLRAENPAYPALIPMQELLVQGVLATLIRCYRR